MKNGRLGRISTKYLGDSAIQLLVAVLPAGGFLCALSTKVPLLDCEKQPPNVSVARHDKGSTLCTNHKVGKEREALVQVVDVTLGRYLCRYCTCTV